ncbi:beta family protein [Streptomyces sp. NBC_00859]|uniref:beta family protein n=1 Tax=Streptomyces sp. NBC_00859 TaxID=2903682 RepID=UPI00386A219E|nr:beta family protein [Streptomyces sp. NBC_00859]
MVYVPILKAKAGEFKALQHATPEVRSRMCPVMELAPDPELVRDQLETFSDRAMDAVPNGVVLAVDCGALPAARVLEGDTGGPIARLSESLDLRGVAMRPVVRLTDTDEVLGEAAAANARHQRGVCLRVSTEPSEARVRYDQIQRALRTLHLEPEEVDFLLDAGPVRSDADASRLAERVLKILDWLSRWRWRRQCVAAGAFPANLTGFPRGQATPVARQDEQLWRRVAHEWHGEPLDFGDFGVTHPRIPKQSRGTPDPNMRYTTPDCWQVFVYPRVRAGNDDFFTLSRDLVTSPHWPATGAQTSWGDARLEECADRRRLKAGGGTQWRAWATSHHLAVVTAELAALGHD